jgi:hypothetical protein
VVVFWPVGVLAGELMTRPGIGVGVGLALATTLIGFSVGWRVSVGPGGLSVARTVCGIPLRFYRLGSSPELRFLMGFDEGSDAIEVRAGGRVFELGSLGGHTVEDAYDRILEGIERAGLETEPLEGDGGLRVFQPRSTPITF